MEAVVENRRRFNRRPIALSALVHPPRGRSWLCSIRNFCEDGMLLAGTGVARVTRSIDTELQPQDEISLHFSVASSNGQKFFRTRAIVARVLESGHGLGVRFEQGLDADAFQALMEFAVAAGAVAPPESGEQLASSPNNDIEALPDVVPGQQWSGPPASNTASTQVVSPTVVAESSVEAADSHTQTGQRQTLRDPRLSEAVAEVLLHQLEEVIQLHLQRIAVAFCKRAEQALMLKARDAGTNALQTQYLEALGALEKSRVVFTKGLVAAVVAQLTEVSDLKTVLERRRKRNANDPNSTELALVDTSEFESWLQVADSISRSESRFKEALLDIRAQLGLIAKPWSHKDVVPVGPAVLWWAFDDAAQGLVWPEELRKWLFSTFEKQLFAGLPELYGAIGGLFIEQPNLPALEELRESLQPTYTRRNRAGVNVSPQEYAGMDQAMRDVAMAADRVGGGTGASYQDPFNSVGGTGRPVFRAAQTILNLERRTREKMGHPLPKELAPAGTQASEMFDSAEIFEALSVIQRALGDAPLSETPLRPKLMQELENLHGQRKGLSAADYDTLKVMENLLVSLSEDKFITEGVREWLQRLEITLNKLATRDPEFLQSDPDAPHSAIQMLNQLARLGNTKDVRQGIDAQVGRRVDELLQRVVRDYDENPEIFDEVVNELHPLIDRQSKTYRDNVERTVRTSEGQQKLARARLAVVEEITQRLGDREVPELLLALLDPGWRNLLVHSHLRHGPESSQWQDQLGVVDQLYAQLMGLGDTQDLNYVPPDKLLLAVVEGLNSISFDPSKRTPLVMQMSQALVGDTTGKKATVSTVNLSSDDIVGALGLEGMIPDLDPEQVSEESNGDEAWRLAVERARGIQVGEWLATSDAEGRPLILTVAFVGDEASSFALVNRKGTKVSELSLTEMSRDLHAGRVTLLDDYDLPLMERASQRMLENMHNQLAFQASHDELTQLLNRKEFERVVAASLDEAKRQGVQHAVLYIDLDQFKIINNTSGHKAGDELLCKIGEVLTEHHSRPGCQIARLGGDEFGIFMKDVSSMEAREVADQILTTIRGVKFEWEGRSYNLTASMGLVFVDSSTESVDAVMQYADEACFSAKDAGRNRLQEYELGDKRIVQRHGAMEWVTQLDAALEDDRLILNCQKIAPVDENALDSETHYEILLTMLDELGEIVAPTELINAAETYNRMTSIDRWVIRNVLQWMAENRSVLETFGGFAINVSGHSVNDTTFPDFVLEQFTETKAPTSKVCFEITETAAIANLDNAVDFMDRMRIIGCRFSLDDFGTGLSSYSYLRNLPVDYVKIDGVFVKDMNNNPADYAVVRSINEIGHYMGKRTVAEYVESMEILDTLREMGVDYAQGYAIGKPELLQNLGQ